MHSWGPRIWAELTTDKTKENHWTIELDSLEERTEAIWVRMPSTTATLNWITSSSVAHAHRPQRRSNFQRLKCQSNKSATTYGMKHRNHTVVQVILTLQNKVFVLLNSMQFSRNRLESKCTYPIVPEWPLQLSCVCSLDEPGSLPQVQQTSGHSSTTPRNVRRPSHRPSRAPTNPKPGSLCLSYATLTPFRQSRVFFCMIWCKSQSEIKYEYYCILVSIQV